MPEKKLSVVVPVYFNAESLPPLFQELAKTETLLKKRGVRLELIFVDDGSKDGSLSLLLGFKKKRPATKVIKLTRNFGAVHCSKAGLKFVTGNAFTILAADLQDPPALLVQMADLWLKGSKFVICERITRDDPWTSKLFSAAYYWLLRNLVFRDYPRGGFDMALMDRDLLPPLLNSSKSMYTPLLAYWLGYEPAKLQYHRPRRLFGRSRWTFRKKLRSFLDVMLGFSVTPIRLISALGLLVSLASFGYGTSVVLHALWGNIPVQGFSTMVALITFLLGLIIIMLGVIGEYLLRIFEESNHRPEAVIEKVL